MMKVTSTLKIKDWYADTIKITSRSSSRQAIADGLRKLSGEEFEAIAYICQCGAVVPVLEPYDAAHAHFATHQTQESCRLARANFRFWLFHFRKLGLQLNLAKDPQGYFFLSPQMVSAMGLMEPKEG